MNIIFQQTSIQQDIQSQAKNNGFFVDSTTPLKMHKEYNGAQLKILLTQKLQNQLTDYQDIIEKDNLKLSLEISDTNIKCNIISDSIKTEKIFQIICKKAVDLMPSLINAVTQYYIDDFQAAIREKQLTDRVSLAKLGKIKSLLEVSNDIIDNDIKWDSWFGSLKKVLREAAMCKIDIEKLKLLSKLYFQISLINN